MTIKIADTFEVLTAAPIDDRMVMDSYDDLQNIDESVIYEGMTVYVVEDDKRYEFRLGTFNEVVDIAVYSGGGPGGYNLTDNAVSAISNSLTSDNIPEGTTNLYFTDTTLGNSLVREQFAYTAYDVLPNDHYTENYNITTNFQLMQIEADAPCRVRLYASEAGRANDIPRAFGAAIDPADGLFVDFVITNANVPYNITPSVMVFSESSSQYSAIYATTTNLDVTQKDVAVTLTYVNFGKVQLPS